jgi:hypothetical protein
VVFIKSQAFTRRLHQLARVSADEVLRQIQEELLRSPEKSDVAQGLGGIRKARTSNPTRGKGKRGGYRYMHLYLKHRDHIHLLFLLDKDEQEDLTTEQRKKSSPDRSGIEEVVGGENGKGKEDQGEYLRRYAAITGRRIGV